VLLLRPLHHAPLAGLTGLSLRQMLAMSKLGPHSLHGCCRAHILRAGWPGPRWQVPYCTWERLHTGTRVCSLPPQLLMTVG